MNLLSSSLLAMALLHTNAMTANRDKLVEKVKQATSVVTDFGKMRGKLPTKLIDGAEGVAIIPRLVNVGAGTSLKRGRGIVLIKRPDGSWSSPVFVTLTGGSFGMQAGIQKVDLVLVFKNSRTLTNMKRNSVNIGGDVSATAGPFGRHLTAHTNVKLDAEMVSYSRSKGLFAGVSLSGSVLGIDEKSNRLYYPEQPESVRFADLSQVSPEVAALKQLLTDLSE